MLQVLLHQHPQKYRSVVVGGTIHFRSKVPRHRRQINVRGRYRRGDYACVAVNHVMTCHKAAKCPPTRDTMLLILKSACYITSLYQM